MKNMSDLSRNSHIFQYVKNNVQYLICNTYQHILSKIFHVFTILKKVVWNINKYRSHSFPSKQWCVFTDNSFAKCSWAHLVISIIQSCFHKVVSLWMTLFVPDHDTITCYQWTCFPVECDKQLFLERSTTLRLLLLLSLVQTCHCIKFQII